MESINELAGTLTRWQQSERLKEVVDARASLAEIRDHHGAVTLQLICEQLFTHEHESQRLIRDAMIFIAARAES